MQLFGITVLGCRLAAMMLGNLVMIPKYLYRGDKIGNPTLPEHHYFDGLHSKLIQSGNPAYITQNGIYKAINSHISPQNDDELSFYRSSHFLSFTESIEVAKYYASDKKPIELIETPKYTERRYIFIFNINKTIVEQKSKFIFKISFKCNRNLIESRTIDTPEPFDLIKNKCELCQIENMFHTILLLDVVSILKKNPEYKTDKQSLFNAERDKEWLILPYDYKTELFGFSANIPRADFWSIKYFRLSSEKEREDEELNLGMII